MSKYNRRGQPDSITHNFASDDWSIMYYEDLHGVQRDRVLRILLTGTPLERYAGDKAEFGMHMEDYFHLRVTLTPKLKAFTEHEQWLEQVNKLKDNE